MIPLLYLLALVASQSLAAPANSTNSSFDLTQAASPTSLSSQAASPSDSLRAATITSTSSVWSTSLLHLTNTTSSQSFRSNDLSDTAPVTSSLTLTSSPLSSTASATPTSPPTSTVIVTDVVTAFETTTVNPTPSSTSLVTVLVTATTTVTASPTPSRHTASGWVAPPRMTDLSAFNITNFPTGQRNLRLVAQIPLEAMSVTKSLIPRPSPNITAISPSTLLQLVYPAHSVNPGSKPAGGAGFYATPLDLAGARNVTLDYSVFFPAGFDWVKGGKLPGLFGGHTGCSGGASAQDCFSTRLMWRPHGVGELYLYAPKDKQSKALCEDVQSVCDTTYGFSVGRGAFNFTVGGWTRLSQNVLLNTPGQNDGGFTLVVDGRLAIHRTDMFYRNSVGQRVGDDEDVAQPAEFLGLFFSTFFGGHGKAYATPKQQYTWFKDFAITRHD